MSLGRLITLAFKAILRNGFRTVLTMLGIIIGVAAVIAMLAVGAGTKKSIRDSIAAAGANMLFIMPGSDLRGPARSAARVRFYDKDLHAIVSNSTMLSDISPIISAGGTVKFQAESRTTSMYGVEPPYMKIRKLEVEDGRMFTQSESSTGAKVCLIGQTIVGNLFGDMDPVGQSIRFNQTPFVIIGTIKSKGQNSSGMDTDDMILAPFNTVRKRIVYGPARQTINQIYASVIDESLTQKAIAEVKDVLRVQRKLRDGVPDDFTIRSQQEISNMMESTSTVLTALLTAVAAISLLVGGIGIMNIMFVSVTERTREIGLRMAVGAKDRDILWQFLIEAIMISLTGGLIGMIFGVSASLILNKAFGWTVVIMPSSIIISFAVCVATGVFFGWYPAFQASKSDPIEALRYE
ncbi:MAG: ABC transporter permease [Chitinispirillales bacterium]|jgi:putative ABC transport system permease protein|nr:ABC transporter permease [Chitinispirillales bacterium]